MRYFIIAGDPSGDLHGAKLIKAIRQEDQDAEFRFFGGEAMTSVAGEPLVGLENLAFMGFTQLLEYTGKIRENFSRAKKTIEAFKPDRLILIDYAGFNLRMARWASKKGYRVVYYISPKVWAWRSGRAHALRKYCDQVLCILPFEISFLKPFGVNCHYVGNPVLEDVEPYLQADQNAIRTSLGIDDHPVIALLPGSRDQEIRKILPVMGALARHYPKYRFIVAAHNRFSDSYYQGFLSNGGIKIVRGRTQEILAISRVALVTSGTATFETAIHGVPQVVCYKTGWFSYLIARAIIKVPYISLVNLILERPQVPELIQEKLTVESLIRELDGILNDCNRMEEIQRSYMEMVGRVGNHAASARAAALIVSGRPETGG